jgi:predicted AAA+ superfamily ATPase
MVQPKLFPRFAEQRLVEALADSPAVLLHGPRQCGKTTLAQVVGGDLGYAYFTFDDDVVRGAAEADPAGFVAGLPERSTLDEVQRVPSLFSALKTAIDRERTPGRFLLTGSANVLLVPRLSDSLAGRMEILRLHPLAQCEIELSEPRFLDLLFAGGFVTERSRRLGADLGDRIAAGGYPAALARGVPRRRAVWYRDYVTAMVERDVRSLARISSLDALPRLLSLSAGQTGHLLNVSDLAGPFQLSRPTIRDYLTLLERIFLVEELPPWHSNRLSRLQTPKLPGDTGVACALLGLTRRRWGGPARLASCWNVRVPERGARRAGRQPQSHFRDQDGAEVDVVIERGRHSRRGQGGGDRGRRWFRGLRVAGGRGVTLWRSCYTMARRRQALVTCTHASEPLGSGLDRCQPVGPRRLRSISGQQREGRPGPVRQARRVIPKRKPRTGSEPLPQTMPFT